MSEKCDTIGLVYACVRGAGDIGARQGGAVMEIRKLFEDQTRYCSWCNCPIPADSESEYCKPCQENALFREVKYYVWENEVNEFQLAEIFDIPLRRVKQWIREGRLEYREKELTIKNLHCERCGKEIQFGTYCTECNRVMNGVKGGFEAIKPKDSNEKIRFYNNK